MSNYFRLSETDPPEFIKRKPKWLICLICMVTITVMIVSAISVGVFIGYAYCYVEHQTGLTENITQPHEIEIIQNLQKEPEAPKRTINDAIKSFVSSRIKKISNFLWSDDNKPIKIKL
ncbi:uncharacterized protein LOC110994568 [Pieris rapae]|uniref:uncharacterized protein LOC110994568 n=1 Tax=Pieris rapae TaxID=64459 RepID=UPI001E27A22F|nr:uncharacterized protein LOC110994568 [Pieris rapae]